MPTLYCAAHAGGHEDLALARQEEYRQAGEAVLLVHGALKTGPHRCDECNVPLERGDEATWFASFPAHAVASLYGIDIKPAAGRYFDMKRAVVRRYGAA
jgi:hypothetical protein